MLSKILRVLIYGIVFLVPVFFLPFTFEWLEFNKLYLLFFLTWLAVIVWLLKMIVADKKIRIRYSLLDLAIFGFLAVVLASSLLSADKISGLFGTYGRFFGGFFMYLTLAAFYFLTANNIGGRRLKQSSEQPAEPAEENYSGAAEGREGTVSVVGIFKALILSGALMTVFALANLFGLEWFMIGESPIFLLGSNVALFLTLTLLPAVFMLLGGPVWVGFAKRALPKIWKAFFGVFVFFGMFVLVAIDFALAWLILIFGLFLLIILALRSRALKENVHKFLLPIALIVVSGLFLVVSSWPLVYALPQVFDRDSTLLLREMNLSQGDSWEISAEVFSSGTRNALLGTGTGDFGYAFSRFRPESLSTNDIWGLRFERSGSYLSELIATTGALGLFAYVAVITLLFIFVFSIKSLILRKNQAKNGQRLDSFGLHFLMIIFVCLLITQVFHHQNLTLIFLFWLLVGAAAGSKALETTGERAGFFKKKEFGLKEKPEAALLVEAGLMVLVLLYAVACYFGFNFYLADVKYVEALNNPDLEAKTGLLSRAVELNPYFPRYKMVLSQVYMRRAEEKAARLETEADQEKAIELVATAKMFAEDAAVAAPNRVIALENLANIYHRIMGLAQEREEFAQMTIEALKRASALEPKNPNIYADIGDIYFAMGKNNNAREYFEKSIAQVELFIRGEISLALMLEGEGKRTEAIEKLESLADRAPGDANVLFRLGRIYYNQDYFDRAVATLSRVLEINPGHSNARFARALAYEKRGETDMALEELRFAQELNPGSEEVRKAIERIEEGKALPEVIEDLLLEEKENGEEIEGVEEIGEVEDDR